MEYSFLTGLIGSLVLVAGAAWPDPKRTSTLRNPLKNWMFFVGGLIMLAYSIIGYLSGGPIFFLILEILVAVSSLMMMLNFHEKIAVPIIAISSLSLIIWSFYLFESYNTVFFIIGLSGIALGYGFKIGTLRRNLSLTLGSALIAFLVTSKQAGFSSG